MRMMMSPFDQVIWFTLLFCWCKGLEATIDCDKEDILSDELIKVHGPDINNFDVNKNFTCLLYPTNVLNCSWTFQSLEKEALIIVNTSVCNTKTVQTQTSKERFGFSNTQIEEEKNEEIYVILCFNIFLQDQWAVYYYLYSIEMLEVLPSPNITVSVTDQSLLVTWGLPSCLTRCEASCLEYELHLDDQERPLYYNLKNQLNTTIPVDLTQSYTVRLRTRIQTSCSGSYHWSNWSDSVTVQARESTDKQNVFIYVAISLGIPMLLLALLLLVRHQSVSKLIFPPIPCPPPKYLQVLQNNDPFVYPDLTTKHDEEVIAVFHPKEEKAHKP